MVKVWSKEPGGIISGPKPALTLSLELGPLARSTSAALNNLVGNALHYQVPLAFPSPHSTKLREATWCFFLSLLLGNSSPIDCRGKLQSFQKRVQKALLSLPGVFSNAFHQGPCGSSTMQGTSRHECFPWALLFPLLSFVPGKPFSNWAKKWASQPTQQLDYPWKSRRKGETRSQRLPTSFPPSPPSVAQGSRGLLYKSAVRHETFFCSLRGRKQAEPEPSWWDPACLSGTWNLLYPTWPPLPGL